MVDHRDCPRLVVLSASHKLIVRTYFGNAQGLLSGARVRVDGVELGLVRDFTVEAQHRDRPIAVRMAFDTDQGLIIPSDSTANVEIEGVLGPTFVEIDTRNKTVLLQATTELWRAPKQLTTQERLTGSRPWGSRCSNNQSGFVKRISRWILRNWGNKVSKVDPIVIATLLAPASCL